MPAGVCLHQCGSKGKNAAVEETTVKEAQTRKSPLASQSSSATFRAGKPKAGPAALGVKKANPIAQADDLRQQDVAAPSGY